MGQKTESHQKASSSSINSKHIATMKFIPCKVKDETNNPFQWGVYMSNIMPAINGQVLINHFSPDARMKELLLRARVVINTSNIKINFTSSFGRLRQNTAPKSVPHVQHDYFSSFNQSNHWFVGLSLTLPSSNPKFPSNPNCTTD